MPLPSTLPRPVALLDQEVWKSQDANAKCDLLLQFIGDLNQRLRDAQFILKENSNEISGLSQTLAQLGVSIDDLSNRVAALGK